MGTGLRWNLGLGLIILSYHLGSASGMADPSGLCRRRGSSSGERRVESFEIHHAGSVCGVDHGAEL